MDIVYYLILLLATLLISSYESEINIIINILSLSLSKWHELQLASNSIKRTLISFLFKFIIYFGIMTYFSIFLDTNHGKYLHWIQKHLDIEAFDRRELNTFAAYASIRMFLVRNRNSLRVALNIPPTARHFTIFTAATIETRFLSVTVYG